MTGYCMKCKESREMQETEQVTMKNGRPATRGKCGECGTGMYRIGKAVLMLCKLNRDTIMKRQISRVTDCMDCWQRGHCFLFYSREAYLSATEWRARRSP